MKLLYINTKGLPIIKDELNIYFYAKQRVSEDSKRELFCLSRNIYLDPAIALVGINASGKTTILRTIDFVMNLLNNEPINHIDTRMMLGDSASAVFTIVFASADEKICRLEVEIGIRSGDDPTGHRYYIKREKLARKALSQRITKAKLFDFSGCNDITDRSEAESYLPDDVSIIIAQNKRTHDHLYMSSLLRYTDTNSFEYKDAIPKEIITFLDPSIERIIYDDMENGLVIRFNDNKEYRLSDESEIERYLSSGTIKGIRTFCEAVSVMQNGGYMIIDEIEDHFNKEIVATILHLFMDSDFNKKGGTIIFSTHYSELLDEFNRNDEIYITENKGGISIENLASILTRNDIKKSEAYQSGYLGDTVPAYESYMAMKKKISSLIGS